MLGRALAATKVTLTQSLIVWSVLKLDSAWPGEIDFAPAALGCGRLRRQLGHMQRFARELVVLVACIQHQYFVANGCEGLASW